MREDRDRLTAFDHEIPAAFFAFNALRSFDLPQLLYTSRADGLVVNPLDGDRERLPEHVARGLLRRRVPAVCADEPDPIIEDFLPGVLRNPKGPPAARGGSPPGP
jgi:hypothetical protein